MADRTAKGLGNQRAVARIDLAALSHNAGEIRRLTRPDVQLCAVVKADAYGHGAVAVARHLQSPLVVTERCPVRFALFDDLFLCRWGAIGVEKRFDPAGPAQLQRRGGN